LDMYLHIDTVIYAAFIALVCVFDVCNFTSCQFGSTFGNGYVYPVHKESAACRVVWVVIKHIVTVNPASGEVSGDRKPYD